MTRENMAARNKKREKAWHIIADQLNVELVQTYLITTKTVIITVSRVTYQMYILL